MTDEPVSATRLGLRSRLAGRSLPGVIGLLGPALAMLWAGIAIAGNVIAAGSKFTTDVPREDLLQVGVAQFTWTGYAEWALAAVWVVGLWNARRSRLLWVLAAPVAVLAVQKLGVYPPLHDRTVAAIAGEDTGDSPLHVVYAALEGVKIALLVGIGVVGSILHARPRD
ncbi:hypothetical protein [uncultured Demequina sp.]|uniref:hypothetical protein n=1 Tax=uncultured Demequina sp. TaxID=693499 RepID=UPI0025FEFC3A|nr:hypothetical protein [uncultured Demequina sp.]